MLARSAGINDEYFALSTTTHHELEELFRGTSFEFELDRVTGRDFKFHARRKGTTLLAHSRGTRDRTTIVSCQIIIFVIKICNEEVLIPILVLFNLENLEY